MELLGGGSLQISNLTEEDAGIYTCIAENSNTTIEAQAQLTVQGTFIILCCIVCLLFSSQRSELGFVSERICRVKKQSEHIRNDLFNLNVTTGFKASCCGYQSAGL